MTPPHDPPRPALRDPHPTPDNLRPLRPPTIVDVARKVDALAADVRHHDVAEKDARDLLGRQHIEIRALREIALEHTEMIRGVATTATVAKSEASRAASGVAEMRDEMRGLGRDVADLTAAMIHERADTAKRSASLAKRASVSAWGSTLTTIIAVLYALAQLLGD